MMGAALADTAVPIITHSTTDVLQRANVPESLYQTSMGVGNLPPNTLKPWHIHAGPEMAYIISGELTVSIQGQAAKTYIAGQSFEILPGVIHETQAGPNGAQYLAVWVGEKGKEKQFTTQVQALNSDALAKLEASFGGKLGVAAIDTNNHTLIAYHADQRFPMGCTSKVMGVAAILQKSENDPGYLQQIIHYQQSDILEWAPITKQHVKDGMTIAQLSAAAISYSDNTAMNLLANQVGGPAGIDAYARSIGDRDFQLDHGWPDEAYGNIFNGTDSSTPLAMTLSIQKIVLGNVLATPQQQLLKTWMIENTTGNERIRAGVPNGWVVGDKTGTGYEYGTANDTAIIWPPHCSPIILTVFTTSTDKNAPYRNDVISDATRIVIDEFSQTDECLKSNDTASNIQSK
jgi:beta-lactamase class A